MPFLIQSNSQKYLSHIDSLLPSLKHSQSLLQWTMKQIDRLSWPIQNHGQEGTHSRTKFIIAGYSS